MLSRLHQDCLEMLFLRRNFRSIWPTTFVNFAMVVFLQASFFLGFESGVIGGSVALISC